MSFLTQYPVLVMIGVLQCVANAQTDQPSRGHASVALSDAAQRAITEGLPRLSSIVPGLDAALDSTHGSVELTGSSTSIQIAQWLLDVISQQAVRPEYKEMQSDPIIAAGTKDRINVMFLGPGIPPDELARRANLAAAISEVRPPLVFPTVGGIVIRGAPDSAWVVEWLLRNFANDSTARRSATGGGTPASDDESVFYRRDNGKYIIVFYLGDVSWCASAADMVAAVRMIAGVPSVFAVDKPKAIVVVAPINAAGVAEWLLRNIGRPRDDAFKRAEYRMVGKDDDTAMIFATEAAMKGGVAEVANQIRRSTGIQRLSVCKDSGLIILRGNHDAVSKVPGMPGDGQ
jgi:hypothetical protein